ncbi:MAG: DUF1244 domain-containing protein, partial [Xanthomonadales bacterium]|nr:DUF1244 domain-containing protein [Xanthomonadales bacterium]
KEDARQEVYGMPYAEWKAKYQHEATPEQQEKFQSVMADPNLTS